MRKTLLLSTVLVLFAGCNTLQNLNIQNPTYYVRNIRPNVSIALPLSASSIDFDMDVQIDNPNSVGLRLDRIDFDLLVDGTFIANGITQDQVRIPARGTGDVRLRTSVGYNQLKTLFRQVSDAIQGDRAKYELRGKAYYNTPAGQLALPFTVYKAKL
jgi:LEA14-like dessication related protein